MFEVIRRKRRIAQGILLLLILPFAFFGIERYFSGGPSHQEAAKVGDAVVTTAELRQAVEERTAQLRQRFGENFDARIVRDPAFVERVLRELIERRLVQAEAARLGVVVTPEALQRAIASFPAFQQDGKFSYPRYEAVLRAQGLTPKAFEAMLAQDLAVQRLVEPIAQGTIVPREQTLHLVAQQLEERDVSVAVRAAADEADPAALTEEALRAYYEKNAAHYVEPAKVRLQYLLVDEEEIGRGLTPSEADLRALYEQAPELFRDPATQQVRPFEEVREALADSWRSRQARRRYGEVREELGNAVFEAIDRLEPVAERFGLKIHETALMPLEEVELAGVKSDKLISALKEAQAQGGQNLEPIELAPGKLAAVRVAEYVPPRPLSFDEARARVTQDLARELGRERLRERAPQWLERLEKGEAVPELSWQPKRSLTRASNALPPELVDEIFKATPPWPRYLGWEAPNGDRWFVRIEGVRRPQLQADDPMVQFAGERIRSVVGNVEWRGWLKTLETRHPVVIRREALQELTAAP